MKIFLLFFLSVSLVLAQDAGTGPIVSTKFGKIQGSVEESRNGRSYHSFKNVPYGRIVERFQPPGLPEPWSDIRNASIDAPSCLQYRPHKKDVVGVEDCLNLNVFSPPVQEGRLLPVVVYLHAGLNNIGQNRNYNPKYFMDQDVILVVPNFRLNVFGFLSTADKFAQGNYGIRDQVQALNWIKDNILAFGGNSARVTIFGSGSGGSDAFIHTISPLSKGLIHNVISMGGAPLSRATFILNPVRQAKKLGKQLECPVDSSEALIACIKKIDGKEILEKMTKLDKDTLNFDAKAWFGPTIDTLLAGQTIDDLILPDNPVKLLKEGKIVNKVPLIIGGNEFEGVNPITLKLYSNESLLERLDEKFNNIAPTLLIFRDSAANDLDAVTSKVREFYFGKKSINRQTFRNLTQLVLDRFMGFGIIAATKLYSAHAPVYIYYFSHTPQTTGLQFFGVNENWGMSHLDDLQYLFKIDSDRIPFPEITKDHAEYKLSSDLVSLLTSFIETGKPTRVWGDGNEWAAVDAGEANKWYVLGTNTRILSPPPEHLEKRFQFWRELYTTQLAKEKETPVVEPF